MKRNLCGLFLLTTLMSCADADAPAVSSSSSPSLIANEVYISRANMLHAIDGTTGTGYRINSDLPNAVAMASINGKGYMILENTDFPAQQSLYAFDTTVSHHLANLNPNTTWPDTDAMTALAGYLYIVSEGTLWRVNASNGGTAPFSAFPDGWANTEAMAALGDSIYAVQDGTLWRVNVNSGSVVPFSAFPDGWASTEAMAATGDSIYAVQDSTLWRVNVNNGSVVPFSAFPDGWAGTEAMTARNGVLYAVQDGALWTVNTSSGGVAQLGSLPWSGTAAMAARL